MKGGIDTVIKRSGPGYMRQLQCLSYKEPKEEEQKNRGYSGWFPHLQGHLGRIMILVPHAGYTTLFIRVDAPGHYYTTLAVGGTHAIILASAQVVFMLGQDMRWAQTDNVWTRDDDF